MVSRKKKPRSKSLTMPQGVGSDVVTLSALRMLRTRVKRTSVRACNVTPKSTLKIDQAIFFPVEIMRFRFASLRGNPVAPRALILSLAAGRRPSNERKNRLGRR